MFITKREYNYIQTELEYWRERAAKECMRADRAIDRLLESVHSMPISDLGLGEAKTVINEIDKKLAQQMREVDEIYNDSLETLADSNSVIL